MENNEQSLSQFGYNIYSDSGEDGIIEKIFEIIGIKSRTCVEFGAWDGLYASNTANLWLNNKWKSVLIEGHKERFASLVKNTKNYNCLCINTYVGFDKENALDEILKKNDVLPEIDFLSIDIDGDDYYIFESLNKVRPRLISCEYNPTIPPDMELVPNKKNYFGCSALSLCKLAEIKNYKFVAITDTNCFFVRSDEYEKFNNYNTNLHDIYIKNHLTYIITGYAGDYVISKKPTYGYCYPSQQKFNIGNVYYPIENVIDKVIRKSRKKISLLLTMFNNKYLPATVNFIKHSSFFPIYEKYKQYSSLAKWRKNGMKFPPLPHAFKEKVCAEYAKNYNINVMIETGTYYGDMVWALRNKFKKIYSIELDKKLFDKAGKRFKNFKHIELFHGDSAIIIKDVLAQLHEPALFWLDGHYSGGETAKGEKETPIFEELKSILGHKIKNHVILIDDARCFDGQNDYPTIEGIKSLLTSTENRYVLKNEFDIIRIYQEQL